MVPMGHRRAHEIRARGRARAMLERMSRYARLSVMASTAQFPGTAPTVGVDVTDAYLPDPTRLFLRNHRVHDIRLVCDGDGVFTVTPKDVNDKIHVSFEDTDAALVLEARADCCSQSWFELPVEFTDAMKGKEIVRIARADEIDLPSSGVQDHDENTVYRIIMKDGANFELILRNSSNGYYSGYLDCELVGA